MKRLECLDGLRGILALYVLLGHMAPFAVLPGAIQAAVAHGGAAVDVFFVLSGLVITQSLIRTQGRAKPFLILRAARIFPVYLAVLAVAIPVAPLSCGYEHMPWIDAGSPVRAICVAAWPNHWPAEVLAHLTMTHGAFPAIVLPDVWVSFLGSAWSLSTEWQFYVLALLLGARQERLCHLLLILAACGVAWRVACPEALQFSRAFLPSKAHFFALGVASLPLVRNDPGGAGRYVLVLAATLAICATGGSAAKLLPPIAWTACIAVQMRPNPGIAALIGWPLRTRAVQYLGAISYCLYLVNEPIHKMLAGPVGWLADGNPMLFTLLWIPAATGLPILASAWLHHRLEAPALRWGHALAARSA